MDAAVVDRLDLEPASAQPPADRLGRLRARALAAPLESWIGTAIAVACSIFVVAQLHPSLLVADTTPAGGDMGAHVWGPAYLRDHLLTDFRLTGWTPDWYAGFPAFHFYMLPPAVAIVLLDIVLPYGIAMKLVTVSGLVALPIAAYVMGRLMRLPFPGPPLLAVATVPFLFDRGWTIYGGNVPSTLAGEYSFSISLAICLVYFGVLARGLETGKHRGLAAVLLALTILCHAIPAFFAIAGSLVLVATRLDRKRIVFAAPILALGCALSAFWAVPFVLRRGYMNDMGWERLEEYSKHLVPDKTQWVFVLGVVGAVLAAVFRVRAGVFFAALGAIFALGYRLDAVGFVNIWNARLLPFYYLCLYLVAAVGASEVLRSIADLASPEVRARRRLVRGGGALLALGATLVYVAMPLHTLPFGQYDSTDLKYRWLGLSTTDDSFVDGWAKWNYEGYERKDAYPEYYSIVSTMKGVGEQRGCGRAHWEYQKELDRYGTPMALMLLPFWTDGCIQSMEGLYFESSSTTPFHFLNAAEVSAAPSNPQRGLPYRTFDLDRGIEHLKLLGVRYYMAFSTQALNAANAHPDLRRVASAAPWTVYEIEGWNIVEPLQFEPAVVTDAPTTNPGWQDLAVDWYMQPAQLDVPLAEDGPDEWQRVPRGQTPARRPLSAATVSNVELDDDRVSFDVDEVGRPVLVKVSYFPNWKLSGADGPYRVTPNLMVVVPTDTHVELRYGYTAVDLLGWLVTVLGIAGVVWLWRRGPMVFPEPPPRYEPEPPAWAPPPPPSHVPYSERTPQAYEADEGAGDPSGDRRPSRTGLLDADGDLVDGDARPFGP